MTDTLNRPAAPTEPGLATPAFPPLTALDRCEAKATVMLENGQLGKGKCGAQAFVRAVLPSGFDLPFCSHHGDELKATLIAQGARILDESGKINTKPTDPSRSQGF